MKQVIQNMRDGKTTVADLPVPAAKKNSALVKTHCSLVSAGTERMVVEFAEKSLIGKASSRPDLVKQVLNKARREGILPTIEAAFNKLDQPMALGYSSAGVIVETGVGLQGFKAGDRVACGGGGFATHAEYGVVPQNLLVPLPDAVDFESAAFTTLGAVALQGFRLSQPQIGESVCVIGLGLLGLLSCEIAKSAGCQVFGIDLSAERIKLARSMQVKSVLRKDCEKEAAAFTRQRGFDHVLICADTSSNDAVELAGSLARDHGKVVAVGAVGMDIPRKIYYEKELELIISRSYGPGRYDSAYEEGGQDYPYGYVRWTEGRNMQAFVDLLAQGKINLKPLITHRFQIEEAEKAYELITGKKGEPFLGVLITYPDKDEENFARKIEYSRTSTKIEQAKIGVLGAGNYAQAVFLPVLKKTGGATLAGISSATGLSASHAAQKFGFQFASSDENDILEHKDINAVAVLTRHSQHTRQVLKALENKKAVYCEKPLALNAQELTAVEKQLRKKDCPLLTVGFNRRFAPMAIQLKEHFGGRSEPMHVYYRVNAGFLPSSHWLHDPQSGGGRILGEGCHFVDFVVWLTGERPVEVSAQALPDGEQYRQDNVEITLRFANGSLGTIAYLANGNKNFGKERVEVFCGGKIGVLDDFRILELGEETKRKVIRSRIRQDKGHQAAWQEFLRAMAEENGKPPIPYEEILAVHQACFAALASLQQGKAVTL